MAKREIVGCVEQDYHRMLDSGIKREEAIRITRERRKMVETELYRYSNSKLTIDALEENIRREEDRICSPGSPVLSDMPKGPHDPNKTTDKLAESIDKIISWERRLNDERGKNARYERAWEKLDVVEKHLLQRVYGLDGIETIKIDELGKEMGYARCHMYRMKFMALDILALCIFGSFSSTHPFVGVKESV